MNGTGESSAEHLLTCARVQQIPSDRLELFQCNNFLSASLSARLIALIEAGRRPSTLADAGDDHYFRTSETGDLDAGEPAVAELESRLTSLSGIAPAFGEPIQGQRYAVGQEFKPHCDYFNPGGRDWATYCSISGQRT